MIGDRVRENRKSKKYTLEQLAEASGLTASYISQMERNLTEPSISSLRKIAQVLQVPISSFLEEDQAHTQLIRKKKRKSLRFKESGIEYEYLTPLGTNEGSHPMLEIVEFTLEPGKWTNDVHISHSMAEECLFVTDGAITVDCLDETFLLERGDSIYIRSNTPHNIYNHTERTATAIFCATPPVL